MPMQGAKKHVDRLRILSGPQARKIAGAIVFEGAETIRAEAHRLVSAGSISGKGHVRSLPGEAPNREFGDLQAGFKTDKTGPLTAEFRSEAVHAAPLEFGTSRMAARPYVRPARDNKIDEIRARFVDQMNALVRRSG